MDLVIVSSELSQDHRVWDASIRGVVNPPRVNAATNTIKKYHEMQLG